MNNKVGLKDMFEHKEALTLMARSLNPNLPHVMQVPVVLNILKICFPKRLILKTRKMMILFPSKYRKL